MHVTVEGTYADGKIELSESPAGVKHARVLVTFLPSVAETSPSHMTYGQFAGEVLSSEEDFLIAEWRGR